MPLTKKEFEKLYEELRDLPEVISGNEYELAVHDILHKYKELPEVKE